MLIIEGTFFVKYARDTKDQSCALNNIKRMTEEL